MGVCYAEQDNQIFSEQQAAGDAGSDTGGYWWNIFGQEYRG